MGSATIEGRIDMGEKVIINIKTFLDGHAPPDRVHPGDVLILLLSARQRGPRLQHVARGAADLGAEQHDDRGVVDPHHHRGDATGGTEGARQVGDAENSRRSPSCPG